MLDILLKYIPNVLNNKAELIECIYETLIMISISGIISLFLGIY